MNGLLDSTLIRAASIMDGRPNCLRLKEQDPGASLKELILTHMPDDSLVCDLDPIKPTLGKKKLARYSWFFDSAHPIATKQCDGAVYFSHKGSEYLFLVELKSSASGIAKGKQQLAAGSAFAKYMQALLGRDIEILSRLVYVGSPSPTPVVSPKLNFPKHKNIPVICNNGRSYLSLSQLIA